MKLRPLEYDPERAEILFFLQENTGRHVKVTTDKGSSEETIDQCAAAKWKEKYGEPMPDDDVEPMTTESMPANLIPYDGSVALTDAERAHIDEIVREGSDLNFDMLYFAIEGCGWRPLGNPADSDLGWKEVFAREREELFFADIIADLVLPPETDIKTTLARIARIHAPDLVENWERGDEVPR